jgi:phage replication-related protein YjqB (UPF0714/DUF867 family)
VRAATVAVVDEAGGGHEEGAVVVVARALAVELAGAEVDVLRKQNNRNQSKNVPAGFHSKKTCHATEASKGTRLPRRGVQNQR